MIDKTQEKSDSNIEQYPEGWYSWYVVSILTLAYIVSFIDRQILNLLVEPIKADMHLSDTQISLLMGLAFGIFYTFMAIPLGRLADRKSRRMIIACGITVWCFMTAACGLARNYLQLFIARIGVGVGEAALTPSALSLITDYFPKDKRGRAIGFYNMGISLGVGIAMIFGGYVIHYVQHASPWVLPVVGELYQWQSVFIIVGLPGLLIAALMLTVKEPSRKGLLKTGENSSALSIRYILNYLLERRRVFISLFVGMSVVTILGYAYFSWVPTMFIRTFAWSIKDVGLTYGLILLVFGPIGVNFAGWLADKLHKKGYTDAHLRTVLCGVLISLPGATLMPLMPTETLAVVMLIPANLGPAIATAAGASSLMMIIPNQMRGQVSALYLFVISILGLTLGPTAVALVTDYVFADESALRYSIAVVSFISACVSSVLLYYCLRYYREAFIEAQEWME